MLGKKVKTQHYFIAGIISFICFGMIALHLCCPKLSIDQTTVLILALAIIPWLTPFFKKLTIPGILEGETHERMQGTTKEPLPPKNEQQVLTSLLDLSDDAKKILATLWRYQKQHFKDDYSRRWTFKILPQAYQYSSYLSGLGELLKRGLAVVSPENEQCMLTNEGIDFITKNVEIQNTKDIYKF